MHFHPRASESKLATAALGKAYSMELGSENVDSGVADLNLASELIDIAPTGSLKPHGRSLRSHRAKIARARSSEIFQGEACSSATTAS